MRSIAVVVAVLFLWSSGWADTHTLLLPDWESTWWTVYARVEGQDVKFIQEGNTGAQGSEIQTILYTAPKEATVSVYTDFHGELPQGVEPVSLDLEINGDVHSTWTIDGGVATTVINLSTNKEAINQIRLIAGRAVLHTTDPNWTPSAHFLSTLYVVRPISVSAGGALGGSMSVYAYSNTPCIQTNVGGQAWVDYKFDPLPNASVKVEPILGAEVSSGWLTTDDSGRAVVSVWAETSSPVDEAGYVHGTVRIKGVKDRATVERETELRIPYALVVGVNGASLVGRAGAIIEPWRIIDGDVLKPGDVVQVGNELIGSGTYLTLKFCNGQQLTLQSDTVSGVRAVVGQGSFDHRTPVLTATLQNVAQEIRSDPRRYGRFLFYKAVGNAVDNFLGLPDPVGWTVTTPGGAVEEWLAEFGESAYQPKSRAGSGQGAALAGGTQTAADAPWAGGMVDFYSDGTVRVYNRGATVAVRSPSGSRTVPLSGMTVGRLNTPGGELAAVGAAPATGNAPIIELAPAPGATEVPIRPGFRLNITELGGNTVLPGSVVCRLDGYLLPMASREENRFALSLPPGMALTSGTHEWDVELAMLGGAIVRTSATFQVTANLPAPQSVRAVAGAQRVSLRWDAEALEWAHGGFRVYRTAPPGMATLVSGAKPLRQPNFVDLAPMPGAMYEVAGLDASGREGARSAAVTAAFPGAVPSAPKQVTVTPQALETGAGLALLIEDSTPGFTLWRIEAAESAGDPFADVLDGELTSVNLWPIPRPFEETRRWWRVTAVNVDGQQGPATVVGPVALPAALPPVAGLTASPNPDGSATLRWNPWTARSLAGYRVERWVNNSWTTAAEVGADTFSWTDPAPNTGDLRQWRVKARLADGGESPASASAALRLQPVPANRGIVRFASDSLTGAEGGTAAVRVIREDGLELPAFVTWSSWGWAGTALPNYDYAGGSGLLVFAPGETEKVISVPLLPDAEREQPDEVFYIYLRGVEGGPVLGKPSTMQIVITEGPELAWEQSWLYTTEDGPTEIEIAVVLSSPAAHLVQADYEFVPDASTAAPGEDFIAPLSGTLTLAPGQTRASFTVLIINDNLKEGTTPENAVFRLFNLRGAAIDDTDPFRVRATLQISDDDTRPGQAVFVENAIRLREGESRTLTIRRQGGSDGPLQVFLFPMSGNATEDEDWTLTPRSTQFEDGQTEINVTLKALTDNRVEGAELVVLGLHGGFGPGQMSTLLITIEDADGTVSGFSAWANEQLANYPPTARAADADADADGLPNWIEYLWRTNPAKPDRPAPPQQSFSEWGEWQVRVTVREDAAALVLAEFADNVLWTQPVFDAGTWQSNGDGTRTGLFKFYSFGTDAGFVRFRSEWLGGQ
ncbi:MAG: Calx-beta domain-containing protein [Verrucomicrobiia bacterium]